jgi:uncharacterized protein (DUF433 family)
VRVEALKEAANEVVRKKSLARFLASFNGRIFHRRRLFRWIKTACCSFVPAGLKFLHGLQPDIPELPVCTPQGVWRTAGTRVSLDSVIYSFVDGATAEEICQDFPSLSLAQVYGTIAYYLQNRDKVDAYLKTQGQYAAKLRQELKARQSDFLRDLRQRLCSPVVDR